MMSCLLQNQNQQEIENHNYSASQTQTQINQKALLRQKVLISSSQQQQIPQAPQLQQQDTLVKELQTRVKIMTSKFLSQKSESERLREQNKALTNEVAMLRVTQRSMVKGFSNSSSDFPLQKEFVNTLEEFYKYDCVDIFFDLFTTITLNIKDIAFMFKTCFENVDTTVHSYFMRAEAMVKEVGCLDSVEGPVQNVLLKCFQPNMALITKRCFPDDSCFRSIIKTINNNIPNIQPRFDIDDPDNDKVDLLYGFINKLITIVLTMHLSDPPYKCGKEKIGCSVPFNSLFYEPFDGFIANKEETVIILPAILKRDSEILVKAMVLQLNHQIKR